MTTDYGLRLDAHISLAETLGRVHNEWRKDAKLRPQTTDNRLRTKVNSTLNRHKISFKKIRDALVLTCNRRTAIQNVIAREACVQALSNFQGSLLNYFACKTTSEANLTYFTKLITSQLEGKPFVSRKSKEKS